MQPTRTAPIRNCLGISQAERACAPLGEGQEERGGCIIETRCRNVAAVCSGIEYWIAALTRDEVLRQRRLNVCMCMGEIDDIDAEELIDTGAQISLFSPHELGEGALQSQMLAHLSALGAAA